MIIGSSTNSGTLVDTATSSGLRQIMRFCLGRLSRNFRIGGFDVSHRSFGRSDIPKRTSQVTQRLIESSLVVAKRRRLEFRKPLRIAREYSLGQQTQSGFHQDILAPQIVLPLYYKSQQKFQL